MVRHPLDVLYVSSRHANRIGQSRVYIGQRSRALLSVCSSAGQRQEAAEGGGQERRGTDGRGAAAPG